MQNDIKTRYLIKQLSHSGATYLIRSEPYKGVGVTLIETKKAEDIIDYVCANKCLLERVT